MRVLAFGTFNADVHPRVAVLLAGLRAHGHHVDVCNEPLRLSTAQRVATLRQPWRLPRLAWELGRTWWRLVRMARHLPRPGLVVVGFLGHFDVLLARRVFRDVPIALDLLVSAEETALDRGTTNPVVLWALRRLDRAAVRAADLIIVDTEEHRGLAGPHRQADTVVVPVGAPDGWFAADAGPSGPAGPLRVIFFGFFTPLQGAPVIGAALRLLADDPVDVTMVGSGQDYAATVDAAGPTSRVTWLPWIDPESLPGLVASHDVCLGIFGITDKALKVVPNKVFQGMAAGLAVVTSDTPPQRRELDGAAELVPPGDPHALAAALRRLAHDRDALGAAQRRAATHARASMTPSVVTRSLVDRIGTSPHGLRVD